MDYTKLILLITYFVGFEHSLAHELPQSVIAPHIDGLLQKLDATDWDENQQCLKSMKDLLHGVLNGTLWATWMWDSIQFPVGTLYGSRYQLGNFDQCLKPSWLHSYPGLTAQYCLVDIKFSGPLKKFEKDFDAYTSIAEYYNTTSNIGRPLNLLTWGLCLPVTCDSESVSKISKILYEGTYLPKDKLDFKVHSCQRPGEGGQYEAGFYVFLLMVIALITVSFFGTYWTIDNQNPPSVCTKFIKLFDMKKNVYDLIKVKDDQIHSVNVIKTIISVVVIMVHYCLFTYFMAVGNRLDSDWILSSPFIHIDLTIVCFFVLSGLLHMYGMMSGRRINPFLGLLKRYIRLIGPLAVVIFFMASVFRYVGSGPLWPVIIPCEEQFCKKNWWLTLLMINNYVKNNEICYVVTWHLSCDFQLGILGAILYWIYEKNTKIGKFVFGCTLIISALIPPYVTYVNKLPPLFLYDFEEVIDFRNSKVFRGTYTKAHSRACSYLLGMATGYVLSVYDPKKYRKIIPLKWSILGFVVTISFLCYLIPYLGSVMFARKYDVLEATLFTAFNKTFFAITFCVFIMLLEYGFLDDVIFGNFFGFMSNLVYGIYLIHMLFVKRTVYSIRAPATFDLLSDIITGFGIYLISSLSSILLWISVEAPAMKFSNITAAALSRIECAKNSTNSNSTKIQKTKLL